MNWDNVALVCTSAIKPVAKVLLNIFLQEAINFESHASCECKNGFATSEHVAILQVFLVCSSGAALSIQGHISPAVRKGISQIILHGECVDCEPKQNGRKLNTGLLICFHLTFVGASVEDISCCR
jgi:hypothetical protein